MQVGDLIIGTLSSKPDYQDRLGIVLRKHLTLKLFWIWFENGACSLCQPDSDCYEILCKSDTISLE